MFQKIIFINAEAAIEYTLFKGSLSRSKWICQSVRRQFLCISCSLCNFPLKKWKQWKTWGNWAAPETHGYERAEGSNYLWQAGQTRAAPERGVRCILRDFAAAELLHNYENHSQLWRTDTHPLLQGIILTKSGSKCPYSQPFNLERSMFCESDK